jgi:hypothetical protein
MRARITLSALVALLATLLAVGGNSTAANAEASAPQGSFVALDDDYCC